MSSKNTLFSIVIPTRNRAHLLSYAIQSILHQTYDDFELIISDNFSSDNTEEVVQSFNDKRIRYVRTTESLSMNESYKFALSQARGEYISFLSDDDAYAIDLLKKAKEALEETKSKLICWQFAHYYLNETHHLELPFLHPLRNIKKNTLLIPMFSSGLYEVLANQKSGRKLLQNYRDSESLLDPAPRGPQLTNAVYHHSIFKSIENRGIDLFRKNVVPDIYSGVVVVTEVERYFYLDMPLTVFCKNESSTTGDSVVDKERYFNSFYDEQNGEDVILTPIKNRINYNCHVSSVLQARDDFNNGFEKVGLHRETYYPTYYNELLFYKRHGINVEREINDFQRALSNEPKEIQEQIHSLISTNLSGRLREVLRKLPRPQFLSKSLASSSPETLHYRNIIVTGDNAGFKNIAECGIWLDEEKLTQLSDFCVGMYNKQPKNLPHKWQIS